MTFVVLKPSYTIEWTTELIKNTPVWATTKTLSMEPRCLHSKMFLGDSNNQSWLSSKNLFSKSRIPSVRAC